MTPGSRPRFDPGALRRLAGDTVFARGQAYHRDGAVEIVTIEAARVVAEVAGSEPYRIELAGSGTKIGGSCSCPAFERGFCKHLVATALAANQMGGAAARSGEDRTARIRGHLAAKSLNELVGMLMEIASRDRELLQSLDIASALAQGDDGTIEARLAGALDREMRISDFIDYREARGWAGRVDSILDTIATLAPVDGSGRADRAAIAVRLAERAMDGIGKAAASIDDSDGHCGGLMERLVEIHQAAASVARPEPVGFARALFARAMADESDAFHAAVDMYAEVLGGAGLAEYRRLVVEAWEARSAARRKLGGAAPCFDSEGYRLRDVLDRFAERDGDVEARIALRAAELTSPHGYLDLAQFCLAAGREDDALRRAEEGLWMFEDQPPDGQLVAFVVGLLTKAGRHEEAEAHLWRAFEAAPDFDTYLRLREIAGETALERALGRLASRLAKAGRADRRPRLAGWVAWGLHDLPIRILIHEGQLDRAWQAHRDRPCSVGLQVALAQASEATHPADALAVYRARVEDLAQQGSEPSYREATAILDRMAKLQPKADHATYLSALKERFKRRRNLIKLLG